MIQKLVGVKLQSLEQMAYLDANALRSHPVLPLNAKLLEQLGWQVGDTVEVEVKDDSLTISYSSDQTQKFGVVIKQTPDDFKWKVRA